MGVSLLLTGLVAWLKARDPQRLGSRVHPWKVAPTGAGVYLTYKVLANVPGYHLKGPSGIATARIRLEIWSKDHAQAWAVAAQIAGMSADPGLSGFKGLMAPVTIQAAFNEDGGDVYDPEAVGSEDGWYQVIQDYRLEYETAPRG
jgi:hypothetical protein